MSRKCYLNGYNFLGVGGVLSDPEATEEVIPVASSMIVKFESLSAVRKMLESDVYWTDNVVRNISTCKHLHDEHFFLKWDKERLVVLPYNASVPLP